MNVNKARVTLNVSSENVKVEENHTTITVQGVRDVDVHTIMRDMRERLSNEGVSDYVINIINDRVGEVIDQELAMDLLREMIVTN